jgi:hypothetical protein
MSRRHGLDTTTASGEGRADLSAVIEKSEGLEPLLKQVQHLLNPANDLDLFG